ncbi:MAG: DUF523 and DUF1722 domain-containing protein [Ignisphaera sp.]
MARPRIMLSECLGVKSVRYDGNIVFDSFIEILKKYVDVVPICPEVGIGLGIPRNPLVLRKENNNIELIDTGTGSIYTKLLEKFAIDVLDKTDVDGVVLKSASPSCGVGDAKIYGPDRRVVGKGDGIFTATIKKLMPCIPIESEKRLYAYEIRVRFLTKIFSFAELRSTLSNLKSIEELVDFHRKYKYLIMLHSQESLKNLGRLIAKRKEYVSEELANRYRKEFTKALCRNPSRRSYVNVFMHIYSHLKKDLNTNERRYIIDLIERYGNCKENLKTIMIYFRGFIHRFEDSYLAEQRFLFPYPEELDSISQ